jgi:GMP synthase-like glutamine amidotransferase
VNPVLVFRFARTEGPGHFATFLDANRIAWKLVRLDEGEKAPATSEGCAGLGFMGGPMSANDELAWTEPVLALMRDAQRQGVPMIGHCLGGQLMARALGGAVSASPVKEIGWVPLTAEKNAAAAEWLGDGVEGFTSFQWHEDAFAIPPAATRILTGAHVANQGYVLDDRHLGLQCHVEMTAEMIETWLATGGRDIAAGLGRSPAVQDATTIRALTERNLAGLTAVANGLYRRWTRALAR